MVTRKFDISDFTRTSGDGTSFFSMDDTRITFYYPLQTKDNPTYTTDIYQCQLPSTDSNITVYNIYYGFAKWTGSSRQRVDCANSYVYLPGVFPFTYCYVSAGTSSSADDSVFVSADSSVEYIQVKGLNTMVNYSGRVQNNVSTTRSSPCITVGSKFPIKWDGYWESSCEAIWFYISFDREYTITEEEPSYTVTYSPNGKVKSGLPVSYTYKAGSKFTVPQSFSWTFKDGEELSYFTKNADGSGDTYYPGSTYTMPSSSLVLYAQVKNAVYHIYYFPNDKFKYDPAYKTVNYTYKSDVYPNLPREWTVKDHITVTSWNTKADGSGVKYPVGTKFSMPAENFSLYAQSEDIIYTTYLQTNGKTTVGSNLKIQAAYGAAYTVPEGGPSGWQYPSGYKFESFNSNQYGTGDRYGPGSTYYMKDSDYWLYCQIDKIVYKLTLNSNGNTSYSQSYQYNKTIGDKTKMDIPNGWTVKSDRTPVRWSDDPNDGIFSTRVDIGNEYTMVGSNKTFYLICQPKPTCVVTYNPGTGSSTSGDFKVTCYSGDEISIISYPSQFSPPSSDYTFAWWTLENGVKPYSPGDKYTVTDNVKFVAKYSQDYCYVTYDKNGGSGEDMPKGRVGTGGQLEIAACTYTPPSGKVFSKWNSSPDGKGYYDYVVGGKYTFSVDTTIYAIWGVEPTYYVTYYYDTSETTSQSTGPFKNGYVYELISCPLVWVPPQGYTFGGWMDESGSVHQPGATRMMGDHEVKYYANWIPAAVKRTITVVFNSEGGVVTPGTGQYNDNETITYTAEPNSGWYISSWTISGHGTFTRAGNTATLKVDGDATITCTFARNIVGNAITLGPCIAKKTGTDTYEATVSVNGVVDHWEIVNGDGTLVQNGIHCSVANPSPDYIVRCVARFSSPTTQKKQSSPYTIVIVNGNQPFVVRRGIDTLYWFSNLSFSKKIDNVSTGSFTLYAKTDAEWNDPLTTTVVTNAEVYILENGQPIYAGYITKKARVENNFYKTPSIIREYEISFSDYLRKLNYIEHIGDTVYTGAPGKIAYNILKERCGYVNTDRSTLSFQITGTNILSLLDKLGDQCGWRYRSRPYIVNTSQWVQSITKVSSSTYTIVLSNPIVNVEANDIISIVNGDDLYVFTAKSTDKTGYVYSMNCMYVMSYGDIHVTPGKTQMYIWRAAVIDFAPSFYQENSVVIPDNTIPNTVGTKNAWGTNRTALNNSDGYSVDCEYGIVSVSSPSMTGYTPNCKIMLFKSHGKDYKMHETTFIKDSPDANIYMIEAMPTEDPNTPHVWLYLDHYSESLTRDAFEHNRSFIWYMTPNNMYNCVEMGIDCHYVGVTGEYSKTPGSNTCILIVSMSVSSAKFKDLINPQTKVMSIRSTKYIVESFTDLGITSSGLYPITIGSDSHVASCNVNDNSIVYTMDTPHGIDLTYAHGVGAMVQNGFMLDDRYEDKDSPYKIYGSRTLSTTMQSGYSYMDCELVATNYAVYGSNFDKECSCDIALPFLKKDDGQFSNSIVEVGDHIAIYESTGFATYNVKHYELLEYNVNTDTQSGSIKYGTKKNDLGNYIYNLRKNMTTNIIRN